MGGDARLLQQAHQVVGHPVVDRALAQNGALLFTVEGGGVILIGNNAEILIAGGVDLFCFPLV
ncbi:hypothetical protein SDC9_110156 [bioreactor metagenome]|uniref:Uncharacterized protein n=1 Tax=bioreactor metagenome TaxID=1076179 RepID=A0A645BDU7_9ZZZZ